MKDSGKIINIESKIKDRNTYNCLMENIHLRRQLVLQDPTLTTTLTF